jgi:hypothetical protein
VFEEEWAVPSDRLVTMRDKKPDMSVVLPCCVTV